MGAEQSSTQNGRAGPEAQGIPVKACYYEVLQVTRDATQDEIKKAYHKKALELHPDRNYGEVEQATKQFAEVQSAYEILSDPQERAWYDSHRDVILNGIDGVATEYHFENNVRLTVEGDVIALMGKFSRQLPLTDAPNAFYGGLRNMFATLAREEQSACEWNGMPVIQYPDFGTASDDYEDVVRPFYAIWLGFSTKKTYSWKAAYRYSEAQDRRLRRAMERENKRLADEAIRAFNEVVRSLVAFARKRDPRYIANVQSEADRQETLRNAAAMQAARSRAANQANLDAHVVPTWAKTEAAEEDTSDELSEEEHYECVVCRKTFKSEKQYETHEKSKKHVKAVRQLTRQLHKENKGFNVAHGSTACGGDVTPYSLSDRDVISSEDGQMNDNLQLTEGLPQPPQPAPKVRDSALHSDVVSDSYDTTDSENSADDYASRDEIEARFSGLKFSSNLATQDILPKTGVTELNPSILDNTPEKKEDTDHKIGRAKLKRAKRAARQGAILQEEFGLKCANCDQEFASKTKLFSHIKDMDHAQPLFKKQVKRH